MAVMATRAGCEGLPRALRLPCALHTAASLAIPRAPHPPGASPLAGLTNPLGPSLSPHPTTPAWGAPVPPSDGGPAPGSPVGGGSNGATASATLGGLNIIEQWAWELGSEAGSVPSLCSAPSTTHSAKSRLSNAAGDISSMLDGQRLSTVRPSTIASDGGRAVVRLRKEVPQGYWDHVEIVLVNGPEQRRLKPTGIKKGRKLCLEIPSGLKPGDYDVRLDLCGRLLHGTLQLTVLSADDEDDSRLPAASSSAEEQ
mmetsp:Transcript_40809/g.105576  ORF Transcript_40809/g.105576 Transcript_40809/m.105576 type:complete len:255 (-) Transcript_40809:220-984(-)